ncbi:MAG: P-loop NTPase fold protein [Bacteroidota bacterium]|nr:P-loop NTPase fold protein [Bacteroidota bacterium]
MASITDSPISKLEEDYLRIEKYAISLSKFIQQSDTPITVGLQGEWGTGKTSLMSLLLEQFNDEANRNEIASSWVNTWEYSMFKGAKETTPSVLKGMLDKLKDSCKERGVWTLKDDAKSTFNKAGKFLSGIANQVVANQTGINVKDAVDSNSESYVAEIAEVKKMISGLIQELINDEKNPVKKVVFFVDDLDRILPSDAVEVLESLKNIFDIPNCVFILAIDYDVVVKGLESKFGPKTKENEREFRSFFDKIIQVPFTMPVGAYDISSFLKNKLAELNVEINDEEVSQITKIVGYTVGNNPRSLKRYLNTFSLIKIIVLDDDEIDDANDINKIILFATLGIQISYPEIFRLLTQNPNYLDWNKEFGNKINIDLDEIIQDIQKVGESKLTDEAWEQLIWGVCQKDPFLKVKAYNILELFNFLREVYENDKESLHEQLSSVLEFAAITNVDDDLAIKQVANKAYTRTYYEGIDGYFLDNKDNKLFTDEYISLLKTINEKIKEIYAEEISLGHILVDYSKSGGLVFNWKKKSGGKFFQIRIGKTESFLDAPKKTFLQCYVYKSSPNYQHAEILKLIPAQSLHSSWMFYCVIRNIEDFNILLKSKLIDKGIECIDKNIKYSQSNLKTNKELKPIFIEDIRKVRDQNFEF